MRNLSRKYWVGVYLAVLVLTIAQVSWWAVVFFRTSDQIADLQLKLGEEAQTVWHAAFHRKVMFSSESLFFALSTWVGLYVLFRALSQERRSRQIQSHFIEIVSHESKTPLTALKLRLESLAEKFPSEELQNELKSALEEVRRLSSVVEKTLALHRSERSALSFEPLELGEVIAAVLKRLEPWLRDKGAKVQTQLEAELCVRGDFYALQNSVQSLVENAVLYNPRETKQVLISGFTRGRHAVLRVKDNGPGIADGDRSKIFERFYRGNQTAAVAGTGLGLYLAQAMVKAHHGVLRPHQTPQQALVLKSLSLWSTGHER